MTFANRSNNFFAEIFNLKDLEKITDFPQRLENCPNFKYINKYLNENSYFSVALSNFFINQVLSLLYGRDDFETTLSENFKFF